MANTVAVEDTATIQAAVADIKRKLSELFRVKEEAYQETIRLLRARLAQIAALANQPESDCPYDKAIDQKLADALAGQSFIGDSKTRRDVVRRLPMPASAKPKQSGKAESILEVKDLPISRGQLRAELPAGQLRVLDSLAWWEMVGIPSPSRAQVAFAANYTVNGHFNNLAGSLRSQGLVDYPQGDCLCLTDTGENVAAYPASAGTRAELHDRIRQKLSDPQRRLFNVLLEVEEPLSAEEFATRAGYTVNGHFNNLRGQLRTLQLCEYVAGGTVAAEWLFSI